ncbi:hypothetical protein ACO0M4_05930 [Streptomyces sp. RGM 3693]|uniref:hypothetical protein n=1 Tax=Streptomyces sp. RGM 3693 TaxID=3413284 RepID=UPI003D2E994C
MSRLPVRLAGPLEQSAEEMPLTEDVLLRLLAKTKAWKPFDPNALLDRIAVALDVVPAPLEELEQAAQDVVEGLSQLLNVALAAREDGRDPYIRTLVQRGQRLRDEPLPIDPDQRRQACRTLSWVVGELHDQLVVRKAIKGVPDEPLRASPVADIDPGEQESKLTSPRVSA